eukprot:scaffold98538_cov52-Attheya_sp.AAC.4
MAGKWKSCILWYCKGNLDNEMRPDVQKGHLLVTCKERIWAFWLGILLPEKVHGERGGSGLKGKFTSLRRVRL